MASAAARRARPAGSHRTRTSRAGGAQAPAPASAAGPRRRQLQLRHPAAQGLSGRQRPPVPHHRAGRVRPDRFRSPLELHPRCRDGLTTKAVGLLRGYRHAPLKHPDDPHRASVDPTRTASSRIGDRSRRVCEAELGATSRVPIRIRHAGAFERAGWGGVDESADAPDGRSGLRKHAESPLFGLSRCRYPCRLPNRLPIRGLVSGSKRQPRRAN